ncbi:MAG: SUMF1/EgtB/PvdO family nonheme iron enzyme [Planctomycetota bacterium]|nr:SUMF1/EgtB/PvdO family nonheme iron enzyme [Planctomycetota bacterium]
MMNKFASVGTMVEMAITRLSFRNAQASRYGILLLVLIVTVIPGETSASEQSELVTRDGDLTNSIGMKFRHIPSGTFLMGSLPSDPGSRDDEMPQHKVRIMNAFFLGAYEVTQGDFLSVMGRNTSSFTDAKQDTSRRPVDGVTWYDAWEFCRRLSENPKEKSAGRVYRLPTEAEWEYACRAGTTTVFAFGNTLSSKQANFNGNYPFGDAPVGRFMNRTVTVGSYEPNGFGLYDMHGNVTEWCYDKFDRDYYKHSPVNSPQGPIKGTSPVIRGGNWYSDGRDCRSAFRYADIPDGTFYALGFRVVCELASDGAVFRLPFDSEADIDTGLDKGIRTTGIPHVPAPASGEDWPHWRGPRSDGTWSGPKLSSSWPADGLHRVWQTSLGGGYGGISTSSGRVYVMDRQTTEVEVERVLCYAGVDGRLLWSQSYPVDYQNIAYGNGPRTTPTIHQGRVYTLGATGQLRCLDAVSGTEYWFRDLVADFGARIPGWGLSGSPVIYDNLVIVHAGGQPDACYIAFDIVSGKEVWRNLPDAAGYATPVLIQHEGITQLLCWTPANVHGLDPRTGQALWSIPFTVNFGTSIADPIFDQGVVLVSSYYDGSKAIQISTEQMGTEIAWQDRRNMRALMSQPLVHKGYGYLIDKRHGLTCFEIQTGKKIWDDDNRMTPKGRNPQATLVWLNDENRAMALNSDGDLILMRLGPVGYQEESRANIIGRTWAHPAYSGNCVFARSDTELICVLLPCLEP